jgi:hypothetical protein
MWGVVRGMWCVLRRFADPEAMTATLWKAVEIALEHPNFPLAQDIT